MPDTPPTPEEVAYEAFLDQLSGWYIRLLDARRAYDEAAWREVLDDMTKADPDPDGGAGPVTVVANFAATLGQYLREEAASAGASVAIPPPTTNLDDLTADPEHDFLTASTDLLRAAAHEDEDAIQAVLDRVCAGIYEDILITLVDIALLLPEAVVAMQAQTPPATAANRSHLN